MSGWLSEKTSQKRLEGFVWSELCIMETKPSKLLAELEAEIEKLRKKIRKKKK